MTGIGVNSVRDNRAKAESRWLDAASPWVLPGISVDPDLIYRTLGPWTKCEPESRYTRIRQSWGNTVCWSRSTTDSSNTSVFTNLTGLTEVRVTYPNPCPAFQALTIADRQRHNSHWNKGSTQQDYSLSTFNCSCLFHVCVCVCVCVCISVCVCVAYKVINYGGS